MGTVSIQNLYTKNGFNLDPLSSGPPSQPSIAKLLSDSNFVGGSSGSNSIGRSSSLLERGRLWVAAAA